MARARDRRRRSWWRCARRPGLDRDEVPGEGPGTALPDRERAGSRNPEARIPGGRRAVAARPPARRTGFRNGHAGTGWPLRRGARWRRRAGDCRGHLRLCGGSSEQCQFASNSSVELGPAVPPPRSGGGRTRPNRPSPSLDSPQPEGTSRRQPQTEADNRREPGSVG